MKQKAIHLDNKRQSFSNSTLFTFDPRDYVTFDSSIKIQTEEIFLIG